jgi:GH24 family phage-related lysozyme (muramidase)
MIKGTLKESVLLEISNGYIDEAIGILLENYEDESSRTFEWDLAKEKIDKSTENVQTKTQAQKYLENFLDKIKNLPRKLKIKLVKYVAMSLIGLISIGYMQSIIATNAPDIKNDLSLSLIKTSSEEEVEEPVAEEKITPTDVSSSLYDFLKYEEGSIRHKGEPVLRAYNIGDGAVTVGWGHATKTRVSKLRPGDSITRAQAEQFLKDDVNWAKDRLNAIIDGWKEEGIEPEIDQPMYDAMVSLIFNMGIGNFRNKNGAEFLQHVKNGEFDKAQQEITQMSSHLYRKYPGLEPRREKEAQMFGANLSGDYLAMKESIFSESYKNRIKKLGGVL